MMSESRSMSETIGKLAEALAKAQAEIRNAAKDKDNPFFKSSYADLASIWDACREPLTKNGLSVSQPLGIDANGRTILTTLLLHSSGEWLSSSVPIMPTKPDPQSTGSAITYMRRFSLSSLVGVTASDVDDDGNAASDRGYHTSHSPTPAIKPKAPTQDKPTASDYFPKIFTLAKQIGIVNKDELKKWISIAIKKNEGFSLTTLTIEECEAIITKLTSASQNPQNNFDTFK